MRKERISALSSRRHRRHPPLCHLSLPGRREPKAAASLRLPPACHLRLHAKRAHIGAFVAAAPAPPAAVSPESTRSAGAKSRREPPPAAGLSSEVACEKSAYRRFRRGGTGATRRCVT